LLTVLAKSRHSALATNSVPLTVDYLTIHMALTG
jgi:hypothetical protein